MHFQFRVEDMPQVTEESTPSCKNFKSMSQIDGWAKQLKPRRFHIYTFCVIMIPTTPTDV